MFALSETKSSDEVYCHWEVSNVEGPLRIYIYIYIPPIHKDGRTRPKSTREYRFGSNERLEKDDAVNNATINIGLSDTVPRDTRKPRRESRRLEYVHHPENAIGPYRVTTIHET